MAKFVHGLHNDSLQRYTHSFDMRFIKMPEEKDENVVERLFHKHVIRTTLRQSGRSPKVVALFLQKTLVAI